MEVRLGPHSLGGEFQALDSLEGGDLEARMPPPPTHPGFTTGLAELPVPSPCPGQVQCLRGADSGLLGLPTCSLGSGHGSSAEVHAGT